MLGLVLEFPISLGGGVEQEHRENEDGEGDLHHKKQEHCTLGVADIESPSEALIILFRDPGSRVLFAEIESERSTTPILFIIPFLLVDAILFCLLAVG